MSLREAALKLFRPDALPDEFDDYKEGDPLRADMVMRQLSDCAGTYLQTRVIGSADHSAATVWLKADITDCRQQCERIAAEVKAVYG